MNEKQNIKERILRSANSPCRCPNITTLAKFIEDNSDFSVTCRRHSKRTRSGKIKQGYWLSVVQYNPGGISIDFLHDTLSCYGDSLARVCWFIRDEIINKEK